MIDVYENLQTRKKLLEQLIREKEKSVSKAPQGSLHIKKHGHTVQYYVRRGQHKEVFLRRKQDHLAKMIAQKEYDKKLLTAAEKELRAITRMMDSIAKGRIEDAFIRMPSDKRKLVTPFMLPDQEFVEAWRNVTYESKEFREGTPEFYTSTGIRVRSKSEILIADILYKLNIPYRYEYPMTLRGLGTIYPDFTLLHVRHRKEMYLEHLGMMDDPVYAENALQRISLYEQNGIFPGDQLILLHETSTHPLNVREAERMLRKYML